MLYQHANNTIETKGGWVYYFDTNNIYYCSSVLDYHPYIPTLEEIKACSEQYTAWAEKFGQRPVSDLTARLSYPKTVDAQAEEGEEGEVEQTESAVALDLFKSDLLSYLETEAAKFENNLNKEMYFKSSLGFTSNGDRRTKDNLQDLITFFDYQSQDGKIQYRDFDNIERELTKEQVQTLLGEHVANGQNLYQQKWAYEQQINTCETLDQLHEIKIEFVMKDYTQS